MTLRNLPAVGELADLLNDTGVPRVLVVDVARRAIAAAREGLRSGRPEDPESIARSELETIRKMAPGRVINATGVLLHTNLGRAPIPAAAVTALTATTGGYEALEFDLTSGTRGGRGAYTSGLLCALTGAEDALVVNNNAGGLVLTLAALASGRNAVVSRGELIEIGGSFRLPELMAASGATLVEVGTTNRTRASDYAEVSASAALILKVHPSNYRIRGFTEEVGYGELATIARDAGIPFVADVGSGLLDADLPWLPGPPLAWLGEEPGVVQTLEAGADLVIFSGDKLLGGPQAGIVVGRSAAVAAVRRHPLARAMRAGGATLAGLAATLELYADGRGAEVPFWAMAARPYDGLADRCRSIVETTGIGATVTRGESVVGAGSVPGETIPSPVIRLATGADTAWRALLESPVPIVARRSGDALIIDLRAVDPADDTLIAGALAACR